MKFINFCDANRILLALYPFYLTYILQPLDVYLFRPFSQAYSSEFTVFINKCQGLSAIIKRDFFRLFWKAWGTAFIEENVFSGFKNTGLYPFDSEVVIKRFRVKKKERLLNNKSTGSALKADN